MAALYRRQGRYAQAELLYERALAIQEKALGPEHAHVAASLINLALLYCRQRRWAQAAPLYERALAIREKALGPDHPDMPTLLQNYALLLRAAGRPLEAAPLEARTRPIWAKHGGLSVIKQFTYFVGKQLANFQGLPRRRRRELLFLLCVAAVVAGFMHSALQKFAPGPSEPTFPFTVFVQGKGGASDIVLKNSGYVVLELGGDRRTEAIGEKGQAYFPAIPATFRGQEVPIGVESEAFELSDPKQKCRLNGSGIYLPVQRKPAIFPVG